MKNGDTREASSNSAMIAVEINVKFLYASD